MATRASSRKRTAELAPWAEDQVQRQEDIGGNPSHGSSKLPPATDQSHTWKKQPPQGSPTSLWSKQHPSGDSENDEEWLWGLSGFPQGQLLQLGLWLVSQGQTGLINGK